ncbi:MAG: metal-sensitive transcriptional regulator [bacterium]
MEREVYNRLARIEGQLRGIYEMIRYDRPCKDVLIQLFAVRSALDSLTSLIVKNYIEQCKRKDLSLEDLAEILEMLIKY